jgi:hypothetical protein
MTAAEKAYEPRMKNAEKRAQKELEERRISKAIIQGLTEVLESEDATVEQKYHAAMYLNEKDWRRYL